MKQDPQETGVPPSPPRELPVSTHHPELRYLLQDGLTADPSAPDPSTSIRREARRSAAYEPADPLNRAPVYRRGPGGDMVVPTGRVLVRFDEKDEATAHKRELRAAGYVLDEVLPYATNTAWLRAASGSIMDALHSVDELRKVTGVVALEPEMIGTSAKRAKRSTTPTQSR